MPLRSQNLSYQDRQLLEATLHRATGLLRTSRWSKGAPARDAVGAEIDPVDPRARAFCIAGAFLRAGTCLDTATIRAGMALLHYTAREVSGGEAADLFALNDDLRATKREALAVLERTAVLVRGEWPRSPVAGEESIAGQSYASTAV